MPQIIQIQDPCSENFDAMSTVFEGRHCAVCETKVIDFTKMSLREIEDYFKNNGSQKICGRYNQRHTTKINFFTEFINKIENAVYKTKFRKIAVWTISVVFFLLNSYKCMGKRMEPPKQKKDKKTAQNIVSKNLFKA